MVEPVGGSSSVAMTRKEGDRLVGGGDKERERKGCVKWMKVVGS
jgi:hypothetical protein